MSQRIVLILWCVAGVLAALTFFVNSSQGKSSKVPTALASGDDLLSGLSLTKVASAKIEDAENTVTLKNTKDGWTVAEREDYPANFDKFAQTMRSLKDLTVAQSLKAGPAFNERFGMDHEAEAQDNHGTLVTLLDQSGTELETISVGKATESGVNSPNPMQGSSSGKYIRLGSEPDAIYVVNESLTNLDGDPKSWLKSDFIKVQKIKSLDLATPNEDDVQGWTLTRESESADFTAKNLPEGRELDSSKTSSLKNILSFARFDDVLSAEDAEKLKDSSKARQLVIQTFDNFRYVIDFAPAKNDAADTSAADNAEELILTVEVSADLPEQPKFGADDDTETKKKTLEEFEENQKTLKEKLAAEQAFAGQAYLVANWTLDAANKSIQELTKEAPQPEPTPQPSAEATTAPIATPPIPAAPPTSAPKVAVSEPIAIPTQTPVVEEKSTPAADPPAPPEEAEQPNDNNSDALNTLTEDDIKRIVEQAQQEVEAE